MPSTSIRIDAAALELLRELSRKQRRPVQSILTDAVGVYRRQQFLAEANAAFAALRADPDAWAEEQLERELWEQANEDGLRE
jgi:hypothetical protein